ncbi:MAG: DUF1566 domain-containing protein [Campylobacterota bacterium]|nr:DUF1566 domain-containing protein [Campylobacterota bacterium]
MFYKFIFPLLFISILAEANDFNTITTTVLKSDVSYININSNAKNTTIYLDGKLIGKTPIKQLKVTPNVNIKLKATIDKKYFLNNLETTISIKDHTIPTYTLNFKKATGTVFFVGADGELYVNGKFLKRLDTHNRTTKLKAEDNIKFHIINGYKEKTIIQSVQADDFLEIQYKLINTPLDVRLYTLSIGKLMWEDTKEAANNATNWKNGLKYCKELELGGFKDWKIPTIKQLEYLYDKDKEKIYNGFGGSFYWSSDIFQDKAKIWSFAYVKDFTEGETKKSILEFEQARVRCVRDILFKPDATIVIKKNKKAK